jgi:methionyl-tRNA synthetase
MSKDILRVHSTIWPAMLLSLDLPLMHSIFVHGFFLIEGKKMSKSLGNVIAPDELVKKYGVSGTRYLLISATSFGHDGDIGWSKFDTKYNADLANGLGNLVARTITMTEKLQRFKGMLVKGKDIIDFKKLSATYHEDFKELKIDSALFNVWEGLRTLDKHISDNEPWKKVKTDIQAAGEVLYTVLESLRINAFFLWPFIPDTSEAIWTRLGFDPSKELAKDLEKATKWGQLDIKAVVKKGEALFPRI